MSQRSRNAQAASSEFEKRLIRYALAGSAVLGIPAVSHAGIVYQSVFQPITTDNSPVAVSLDGFQTDFLLGASTAEVYALVQSGTMFVGYGPPTALSLGTYIYSGSPTTGAALLSEFSNPFYKGNWSPTGTPAYLGVIFQGSGGTYYGWAQISTNVTSSSASGELIDYAYNNVQGQGIDAGAGAVPEPSTLALYAVGAAGILALRRRRKSAV